MDGLYLKKLFTDRKKLILREPRRNQFKPVIRENIYIFKKIKKYTYTLPSRAELSPVNLPPRCLK